MSANVRVIDARARVQELIRLGVMSEAQEAIAMHGASFERVFTPSRVASVTRARHALMFLLRERFAWSYPQLGRFFGRDHTSIVAGVRAHADRVQTPFPSAVRIRIAVEPSHVRVAS